MAHFTYTQPEFTEEFRTCTAPGCSGTMTIRPDIENEVQPGQPVWFCGSCGETDPPM